MTPLLHARGVALDRRLRPTDLLVDTPSLIALVGPNGSGKTSLLRALAGAERSSGTVCVDGEDIDFSPPARRMRLLAFVPASRDLVWPIRVRDVVALGLPAPDPERIAQTLNLFELDAFADRTVDRLSTGERSRVLLARAFVANSRLLLLDEPLANLDPYWVLRLLEILRESVERDGCAAILSLHDVGQAERFDRVLLMDQGGLVADAAPTEVLGGAVLADAFRIERDGAGWRVRRPEDRRSSP